jgi:hypothetical protein
MNGDSADGGTPPRQEAPDIFDADGALTRGFLLERGFCCKLGCKNCPYRQTDAQAV